MDLKNREFFNKSIIYKNKWIWFIAMQFLNSFNTGF